MLGFFEKNNQKEKDKARQRLPYPNFESHCFWDLDAGFAEMSQYFPVLVFGVDHRNVGKLGSAARVDKRENKLEIEV